jgi:hypothetical protein
MGQWVVQVVPKFLEDVSILGWEIELTWFTARRCMAGLELGPGLKRIPESFMIREPVKGVQ